MNETRASNDDGIDRKKTEYIILSCLEQNGEKMEFDALQDELAAAVKELDDNVPLHFTPSSGPRGYNSRSFVRALSRCSNAKSVKKNGEGLELTDAGKEFVREPDEFRVPNEFVTATESILSKERKLKVSD